MLERNSNISQSEKPDNGIWNDPHNYKGFNLFSQYPDSKSQSHANQEDMNYQNSLAHNNIPPMN